MATYKFQIPFSLGSTPQIESGLGRAGSIAVTALLHHHPMGALKGVDDAMLIMSPATTNNHRHRSLIGSSSSIADDDQLTGSDIIDNPPAPYQFTDQLVQVGSRYEYCDSIESRLGEGAFGVVYCGRDRLTDARVAIKKVPAVRIKSDELKVMRAVHSAFLVALLDCCPTTADDNNVYLIMELCDADLDRHLNYASIDGKLSPRNLRVLIDNVARGYDALYDTHIVHRDIKPQNILIRYSDGMQFASAKITDFGISRILDTHGDDHICNVAGTLAYMAPEVGSNLLKTCAYDFQVDMWSIGCVFYQCISGQVPFDERSLCRLFLNAAGGNYDAYDKPELPPCTQPEVEALVNSLLEIDVHKRLTPPEFVAWTSRHACVIASS